MYIQPNTNIRILKNVPLDNTYEHTIYFNSRDEQQNYFIGLQKYNLTNYTYQRVKRGTARVGIKSDDLYDCNYMMFQNTSFGNKWFYAFITSVEYVNNDCSEISFELDVMQTWHFDYSPDYCFVEREHSVSDIIGENITPETLETGEYVYNEYDEIGSALKPLAIMIVVAENNENSGNLNEGVYSGCTYMAYDKNNLDGIKEFLKVYEGTPEAILSIYMFPAIALATHGITIPKDKGLKISSASNTGGQLSVTLEKITDTKTLDGYKPKNRKLYTYPYNFVKIMTTTAEHNYRYEFFKNLQPTFKIDTTYTMPINNVLRPVNYKNVTQKLINESVVLDNYPLCPWISDSYRAWLAQNSVNNLQSILDVGALAGAVGLGVLNPAIGVGLGLAQIGKLTSEGYKASIRADQAHGNLTNGNIDISSDVKDFYSCRCSVNSDYARIIDNYFSRFGYATKRVKIPNRNSRRHWNYVKTIDATITGSVPADDMKKICSIYDNGITFWKRGNEIGMYNLDNTVHS